MLGREVGGAGSAAAVGSLPAQPWKAWTGGAHAGRMQGESTAEHWWHDWYSLG